MLCSNSCDIILPWQMDSCRPRKPRTQTALPPPCAVLECERALLEGTENSLVQCHWQQQRNPAKKGEFGHFATAWMPLLTLPAAVLNPELGFIWEGGAHPTGNRLTLESGDRQGRAEPGLQKEGTVLPSPRARQLSPTHRHVRPAPRIARFGNGVHKLSANAEVTELNISISVQKNIGRFDVCKGKKLKPVSHCCGFPFQAQQLQRMDTGSAARGHARHRWASRPAARGDGASPEDTMCPEAEPDTQQP